MKSLNKLKELHEKTTEGEWLLRTASDLKTAVHCKGYGFVSFPNTDNNVNDMKFIAEAHKYLPRLIEALNECRSQRNLYLDQIYGNGFLVEKSASHDDKELEQILAGTDGNSTT